MRSTWRIAARRRRSRTGSAPTTSAATPSAARSSAAGCRLPSACCRRWWRRASGVAVGAVAGYVGGWTDTVLMRATDAVLSVPRLLLLMVAAATLQPSVPALVVLVGAVGWMETARVTRAAVRSLARARVRDRRPRRRRRAPAHRVAAPAGQCVGRHPHRRRCSPWDAPSWSSRRSASSASACSRRRPAGAACSTRRSRR